MSIEPYYMLKMQACEAQVRREIDREQVTHPLADARRFWPASGEVNV